jgi:molecular chaperone GrpE
MRYGASRGCFIPSFPDHRSRPMTDSTETNLAPEASAPDELATLQAKLAEAEAAAAAAKDAQLRAMAELDNVRKRAEREIDNGRKFGAERLLNELLAIADSLDLGMQAAAQPEASATSIAHGMELTQKQLTDLLAKHGVIAVDPVGQPFNPDLHEAVSAVPSAEAVPNSVLSVMQKGYRLHERLLRPAMVTVAKAP